MTGFRRGGEQARRTDENPRRQRPAMIARLRRQGEMHGGYRNTALGPNVPVYGAKSDGLWGEMSLFMGERMYNNQ